MKRFLFFITILLVILAGCSTNKEDSKNHTDTVPEMIEVALTTPETIAKNEEVTIEAHVTQGDENVEDASEVKFEIWKSGEDEHDMLEGEHQGDGVYAVHQTFTEDGTYYVVSHVTARDMHIMPKKEFVVGSPDATTGNEQEASVEEVHHHEHSNVSIEIENKEMKANEDTTLSTIIQNDNEALTDATVRFEIWKEDAEKHEYIDATEHNNGTYQAQYTFPSTGAYVVKVHVTKGEELHEHVQETFVVKE